MDYEAVTSDLFRALRGDRSQVGMSRRLGYRANVAYTWESGARFPPATTLFRAAARTGVDLRPGLRAFFRDHHPDWLEGADLTELQDLSRLLRHLRGSATIVDLARHTSRSRYAVARWLNGESEPRVPDLLRLIDALCERLLDFVAALVDPAQLPSTATAWSRLEAARSLFYNQPNAQLVLLAIELQSYQEQPAHSDGWIARQTGVDPKEVRTAIGALRATGQIRRAGKRWAVARVQAIDTRRHPDAGKVLRAWWARRALDQIERGGPGQFSFNVFTVSEEDYTRLQQLQLQTFGKMRSIIAASTPGERVVLANLQLVPLTRPEDPTP
jgi:transcriptional regulator with XRE-family HTH domain